MATMTALSRTSMLTEVISVSPLCQLRSENVSSALSEQRGSFDFEDLAGVYTSGCASRLFALCRRHGQAEGLRRLPAGRWLCASCSAAERESALTALCRTAREKYSAEPTETVQLIVITGILKWDYQLQVYLGE